MNPGSSGHGAGDATVTGLHAQIDMAPGTVLAGRFRIEAMLGIGGMGVVYRATDLTLDVPVAVKLLRPELAQRGDAFGRFREELLLARQVSSPHVVRIHDLSQHDSGAGDHELSGARWLISMDFIDGEGLDHRLDRDGQLSVDDALRLARQLAVGLAAAHAKGVVHRDLKPANVLMDQHGDAYISDFGVARSLATTGLTRSGAVVGTPDYLSPEQARGERVDARSDLYSLGLILYEMLAGKLPFEGGTVAEVLAQRMLRSPDPVTKHRPEVPGWIARLLDRLLRPQPAHRFQSATEVILAIDKREVPRSMRPRRLLPWMTAALLLLAAGVGGWWLQRDTAPGLAVSVPLERLLVLPIEHAGDESLQPRLAALGEHLRLALAAVPGTAVVDGERTHQALRQLDPAGGGHVDLDGLRAIAAARRVLQPRLARAGSGGWTISTVLHTDGAAGPPVTGPSATDPAGALRAWLATAAVRQLGLPATPPEVSMPLSGDALDAYGSGLLSLQRGELEAALVRLRAATDAAPGYPAAWLSLAEAATATGEVDAAFDAVERGQRAAADAPERMQRRLTAERALLEGDPPTAVAQWRAVLASTPDDTFAELQLGRAQGAGGDFAAAVQTLQTLTQRDPNDPRAWFELGKFTLLSGDAQRAVDDHLVRALVLYKRSRNAYGEAETVNALGIGYGRLGQTADAAEQYRKAVELRGDVGNRRGVATSLRNLANVESLTGDFEQADAHLRQARAVHEALGDRDGLAAVENEIGLLAEERGDYRAALESFRRALQIWQQTGDAHGSAQALNNIGFAHYQLGAYADAQAYWQQAAAAYQALGSQTGQIRTEQNLGLLASARGRWSEARRRLQASLASAEQHQMPEEAAVSRRNLAETELLQGHVGASLDQAQRAEALFRQRDDKRGTVDVVLLRVQALLLAGADRDARAALEKLQPALPQAATEQRAIASMLRAELAERSGDAREARQSLQQARDLASESGVRHLQLQIALRLAAVGDAAATDADALAATDAATAELGHAGLRLAWLELSMRRALLDKDPGLALTAYREASGLLRNGDAQRAPSLHQLGGLAHRALGDEAAAERAEVASREAQASLRRSTPEHLRAQSEQMATHPPQPRSAGTPP